MHDTGSLRPPTSPDRNSMWKRIHRWLTHDPMREKARIEGERVEKVIDSFTTEANFTWLRVVGETLSHQGTPQGNAAHLLDVIARGASYGWDEADYEVLETEVIVSFLGESVHVPKPELIHLLQQICNL